MLQIQQQVKQLLLQYGQYPNEYVSLELDTPLLELGMESINYVQFVIEIEKQFNLDFDPYFLVPEHFSIVRDITDYIELKIEGNLL